MKVHWLLFGILAGAVTPATAAEPAQATAAQLAFFEAKIRPLLAKHCYECHSADAEEGGLRVDLRDAVRQGGDRGPAVVPGDLKASLLLVAASHADADLKMPPKRDRLPDAALADLRKWIEMGAPDPRDGTAVKAAWKKADAEFWAYQPPKKPKLPAVKHVDWPKQEIDRFILARLEQRDLQPSPDAPLEPLLRRLHFDLVGLPPAPGVIKQFRQRAAADGLDAALESEVDRLLSAPQFGERWGRHWLDVARFAESSGKEANISFPYAWRYRDYVINCVNDDVPFDRFLVEQIAGDLLPAKDDAERARLLIATGFLAIGSKNLDEASKPQFEADLIDEQIDAVTRSVMASSIACARCHDHKFDPFAMQDYYALAGIFRSTRTFFGTAVSPANRIGGDPLPLPKLPGQQVFHPSIPAKKVEEMKAQIAAMRKRLEEGKAAAQKAALAGEDPNEKFTLSEALGIFWRTGGLEGALEKVSDQGTALPLTMGVLDAEKIVDAQLLSRGDVGKPGDPVARAIPAVFQQSGSVVFPKQQSGRLELARWLTDPAHPLTARVMANRVWHQLFGAGLVRTVDNFGSTGERPSHPQLLDYLAVRFVDEGWSVKQLVRQMVLSRAYRQASAYDEAKFKTDPDNRRLWRMPKRRLEAEAIRDAMLAASGELDLARPEASLVGRVILDKPISLIGLDKRLPKDLDGSVHRSVYLPVIRDRLPDVLELFDFAEPSMVTGAREVTNVPLQALYLMNSPFVRDRAVAMAARLSREGKTDEQRIRRAFLLCFGRLPADAEQQRVEKFLAAGNRAGKDGPPPVLVSFCQAMLSTAEFRNLD